MSLSKKVSLLTVLICTPLGWMWNYWHYYSGVSPAWGFPADQVIGIDIAGIPAEDLAFYPITGFFFAVMFFLDPLKKIIKDRHSPKWMKCFFLLLLVYLTFFGVLVFGGSGTVTALCFGFPSIFLYLAIFQTLNVWHLIRVLIIVVPTNLIWDLWATPGQWFYLTDTAVFSEHFWYLGIPAEMTPYLGIMAGFFIFGVITNLINLTKGTAWNSYQMK
jgi:hypothetical protein